MVEAVFSTPLVQLPTFLSTISMVGDVQSEIIHKLIQAERKSPSRYEPARDLFLKTLEGKICFENARTQAKRLRDHTERSCAVQILEASRSFLETEKHAPITPLPSLLHILPNGLPLDVRPLWLRHSSCPRLLALHFWRTPLSEWQLSAAATIIQTAIKCRSIEFATCEIDFISVPYKQTKNGREFQRYSWARLKPLNQAELDRFWSVFLNAWHEYKKREPRKIIRKRSRDLFE